MKKDKQMKDIKRRRTCKLVCVLLFFLISVIGICVHFNIVKIPFVVNLLERTEQKQEFGDFSGQLIGESYIPKEENIVYDNDSKTSGYVNNMILIFVYSDVPRKQIVNIADSLGGSIVGEIPEIYQYQIQVGAMDKESLEFYCKKVMRFKEVKYAIVDRVYSMEKEDIALPNDPWRDVFQGILGVDWNEEKPQGYNWWIEATKVLSAWQYNESLATINVGVVDNGFDTSHEDLNITVLNNEVNSIEHHGTHVAGIIGATNNNETGITGILDKVQLYGVDCYATSKQKRSNIAVSSLIAGIELCISNNCKVVNMSSGTAPTNAKETRINAENSAREAIKYLIFMLDSKDTKGDFIITQSAGNGDKNKNGIDAKRYGGYFSSIDEEMVKEVFDSFEKNNIQLEHNISVQDVLDSYMVVGAVDKKKKNGTWQLANFSNYGKTITVCAPGVDVFSTTVMGGLNGNYANDSGTSMAAPIVAGITAMVWSTNLDMSSGTVKNIIQQTADIAVSNRRKADDGSYYMINAAKAIESALDYMPINMEDEQTDIPSDAVKFNGHSYYVYNLSSVTTWEEAKEYCESKGGYLATITSKEEDEFVYSCLKSKFGYENAYFGFTDKKEEGTWVWDNGEVSSYTNWHAGEPNNDNLDENFAMYYFKFSDGTWNDGDFGKQTDRGGMMFICEWEE